MTNFKLVIEYDGTRYHGWQRQRIDQTVQGVLENRLSQMIKSNITLIGSGRTDAGVHALGQTANFHADTTIPTEALKKGLNSLLPDDIVILSCEIAPESFHARYDVKEKTYRYQILNQQTPSAIHNRYTWHIRHPLNTGDMQKAAGYLLGRYDFKGFEGTGSPRQHTNRCVSGGRFAMRNNQARIDFIITADGFLRFMVRNIVGTLTDIGLGRKPPEIVLDILSSKNRRMAGATAPPQGLFLVKVSY